MQLISFDYPDELLCVAREGGIACIFYPVTPRAVVSDRKIKKVSVAGAACKEITVIDIGLTNIIVFAETLILGIVGMNRSIAEPLRMTFNSEMIVGFAGKGTG